MKINNILLPFDGSEHSRNAAKYALDLAKRYQARVTVIHWYEGWNTSVTEIPKTLIEEIEKNSKETAREVTKGAEGIFENQGVEYTLETTEGSPGAALVKMAKARTYDLIVMGSHGHSDIAGLFLGSVTHKVLNTIYCPVLIVP